MNMITCPSCKREFKLDDAGYADILNQVKNEHFEDELQNRLEDLEKLQVARAQAAQAELKATLEAQVAASAANIVLLKAELERSETEKKLAIQEATAAANAKLVEAQAQLQVATSEAASELRKQKEIDAEKLKVAQDLLERTQNMRLEMSTKMLGETLEQHCQESFNMIRAGAFPRATFTKDNNAKSGTKGDYIFRDYDENGIEIVSIMFEMKNEAEETVKGQKNESFLKKLDKDRTEKNCEFAVLVSKLEPASDLYNAGIVDVAHIYPKMYVVRPQFFIPLITLLRNASLSSMEYKKQLAIAQAQSVDVTNFVSKLDAWKSSMNFNWKQFTKQAEDSIKQLDTAITNLEKVRATLRASVDALGKVNTKAADMTIKKLTRGNPTMAAKFKALEGGSNADFVESQEEELGDLDE